MISTEQVEFDFKSMLAPKMPKIAKDCLLSGQEQDCSRITWLFVRCHQAKNSLIHRKMAVDKRDSSSSQSLA